MTIRDLEIFVHTAECGQMSEAARQLAVTQSSVSQSIAGVEKEYGVLLFERLPKQLRLTDTGRALLRYARSTLALHLETQQFLRNESAHPRLRVGASVTVGTCVIAELVQRLEQLLRHVRVEVCVDNTHLLEEMLLKGELDIGLVEGAVAHGELVCETAMDDELVLICGREHPFWGRRSVRAGELGSQDLLLREPGSGTRAQLEEQLARLGTTCRVKWSCSSSEAIINAVIGGQGISVLSRRLVQDRCRDGLLWMCGIDGLHLERGFRLVYHKNKYHTQALDAFIALCKQRGEEERRLRHGEDAAQAACVGAAGMEGERSE